MIAAMLFACGGSGPTEPARPPGVPDGAALLRYSGNALRLDGADLGPWGDLAEGALDRPYEPLSEALAGRLTAEAGTWVALPANATWLEARRAIHTVYQAGAGPIWLGAANSGEAFGPLDNRPPGQPILSCPDSPLEVVGFAPRLTIELHADDAQTWAQVHARFKPLVRVPGSGEPVAAELLPLTCWKPTACDALVDPARVAACRDGMAAPQHVSDRVEVAGEHGCALPLAKRGDASAWRSELVKTLTRLGVRSDAGAMLMADENLELAPMLAVLGGLADHGIRNPQLGLLRMGSGESAPVCTVEIRDAAALDAAGARWFGQQLSMLGTP